MRSLKWMVFVFSVLGFCSIYKTAFGKAPKTVELSESEVATVTTALGYTTMLQFDGRPTSAVLGDQDAFKVEYIGNGIAIKPVVPHAKTNLFVFTDYDRFNFRLTTGSATDADYLLKIRRKGYGTEATGGQERGEPPSELLHHKTVGAKSSCGGLSLSVQEVAWPESRSSYLIQFSAMASPGLVKNNELRFEPGDFSVFQGERDLPIESLHLNRLSFLKDARFVSGTIVLRQADLARNTPLRLTFLPDFHRAKHPACPSVLFSRNTKVRGK